MSSAAYGPSDKDTVDRIGAEIFSSICAKLTKVAAIIEAVRAAPIADTFLALFELLKESEVARDYHVGKESKQQPGMAWCGQQR